MQSKKVKKRKISSLFRPLIGLLLVAVILVQCRTRFVVSGKDDFYMLGEQDKFEYEYALHEGIKNRLLGDYPRAVYFFQRCLEIFPFSDVSYYELSNIFFIAEDIDKSIELMKNALGINNENIWYYMRLALMFREKGDKRNEIKVYEEAARNFPDNYDLLYRLASLYTENKEYDKALKIYGNLEKIFGVDERISVPRQQIYFEAGEYEKAYLELHQLIDKYPEEARYYGMLAELYSSMNMYKEAVESYKKLFSIDPENGIAQLSAAEFFIRTGKFEEAMFYLISAYRNQLLDVDEKLHVQSYIIQDSYLINNNADEVRKLGILLLEEYPENLIARALMVEFYIQRGEYGNAAILLKDLYQEDRENLFFAEQLIGVLTFGEEYEKVIEIVPEIRENFPESSTILYFLGIAYHVNEENEAAIDAFNKALEINNIVDEFKVYIFSYLGDLYNRIGKFEESDRSFDNALKLDSTSLVTLNNYAYYLALREERLEEAKEFSLKAIKGEPENAAFLDTYAWILYKLGEYEEALLYIELSYNSGGDIRYEIVKHYGKILIKTGEYEKAVDYLRKARELTDDPDEIDELILSVEELNKR